jgi:hypothetical protein
VIRARFAMVVVLVAAAPAVAAADDVIEKASFKLTPVGKPFKSLAIENPIGDVRIVGHDSPELKIETVKRAPDDATMDRLNISMVPDPDGAVRITTSVDAERVGGPVPRRAVRIDLVIHAPRDVRVDGRVGDGTLALSNMDAGGELDAATGKIEVKNVSGPVITRSVDAPQTFSEVFGIVDAQALDGDLSLDTVRGDRLSASVHRGRIDGRRIRSRDVDLITTTGDVRIEGEAPIGATMTIATVRGTIDVKLRGGGGLSVRARGKRVTMAGARERAGIFTARFGTGDRPGKVELRTRFGDVRFAFLE